MDYTTRELLAICDETVKTQSFLKDTFFPTNESEDVFTTQEVLAEYKDDDISAAPFVSPLNKNGIAIRRKGAEMKSMTPLHINVNKTLRSEDLKKRGFGEALNGDLTPEERAGILQQQDMETLDKTVTVTEEKLCAEVLLNSAVIVKQYISGPFTEDNTAQTEPYEMKFFDGEANPYIFTPAVPWSDSDVDILQDIELMAESLTRRGCPYNVLLCDSYTASLIKNNKKVKEQLDNRRIEMGHIKPEQITAFVSRFSVLNIGGLDVDFVCISGQYKDYDGKTKAFFPKGTVILTAVGCGRTLYGAENQIDYGDSDYTTYAAKRVPKVMINQPTDEKAIMLKANPLPMPNRRGAWVTAKVITG